MLDPSPPLHALAPRLVKLRGDTAAPPDASVVIPVNARCDLVAVLAVVDNLCNYEGPYGIEVVLSVNNFPPGEPPPEIKTYRDAGVQVVATPSAFREGEAICFSARIPGIRKAASDRILLFDADCRIPQPTRLMDWYVERLSAGARVAYARVDYFDLRPLLSVRARILAHHGARWVKRTVFHVPTTRGSAYAVHRPTLLDLYDRHLLADDLNVGPTVRATGGRVAYSRSSSLVTLTSGRRFRGGWMKLARYLRYRLHYNRAMLPIVTNAERDRRRAYHDTPKR